MIATILGEIEEAKKKKVERYLETLLLKGYEWIKAIPETESLVVRGLKLESKVLEINFGVVSEVPTKSN